MHYLSLYIESTPYPNTLPTRQPIRIEHYVTPSALGSQSESSITSPESSANQNRVLRNPSRHYVTRDLSARPDDPSRLSVRVGSL